MKNYLLPFLFFLCLNTYANRSTDSTRIAEKLLNIRVSADIDHLNSKQRLIKLGASEQVFDFPIHESKYYNILGVIFMKEAKYDSAEFCFEKALQIRKTNNYLPHLASTLECIATLHNKLDNDSIALCYLYQSLSIKLKTGNKAYLKPVYNRLGNTYFQRSEYDSARHYYDAFYKIAISLKDTQSIASSLSNIGNVLYNQDSNRAAINNYKKAIFLYKSSHRFSELSSPLFNIASVYDWVDKKDSALYYYNLAHLNAKKHSNTYLLGTIYKTLTEVYTENGNSDSSKFYLKKYINYQDSVFSQNKVNAILEFETKYQTSEKEQALKLEQINNKNKQKTIYVLIGITILLLCLATFIYWYFRQKKKVGQLEVSVKNQKIDQILKDQEAKTYAALIQGQSHERTRIAQDLHDKLGGSLAAVKVHFNLMNERIDDISSENKPLFDKMNIMLEDAVKDVRNISHDLSTGKLAQLGLKATLKDLADTINASKNIDFELDIHQGLQLPKQKMEQDIYAIVQELVSNTLKHANARHITLALNIFDNILGLIYEDDGIGFELNQSKEKGLGLGGIEKRVDQLKGEISVDSVIGRGTIIIINIPI
ncbi:MAG: tetratricopeptide repeat protein [Crocinitomicaceae bacterium]